MCRLVLNRDRLTWGVCRPTAEQIYFQRQVESHHIQQQQAEAAKALDAGDTQSATSPGEAQKAVDLVMARKLVT